MDITQEGKATTKKRTHTKEREKVEGKGKKKGPFCKLKARRGSTHNRCSSSALLLRQREAGIEIEIEAQEPPFLDPSAARKTKKNKRIYMFVYGSRVLILEAAALR